MSKFELIRIKDSKVEFKIDDQNHVGSYFLGKDFIDLHYKEGNFRIPLANGKKRSKTQHHEGGLQAPMPGKIIKILVKENQSVKKGEVLLIMEAMKMEHKISAPREGIIQNFFYNEGDRVSQGQDLVSMK